jgi:outer membrane cobalamin receptor
MRLVSGRSARAMAFGALAIASTGCAANRGRQVEPMPEEARVITAEQIQRTGANNAWEAIQRTGNHLQATDTGFGEPRDLRWRGHSSVQLSAAPLVYVDGARMSDFRRLRDLPAELIDKILIYGGVAGTTYFGTGGGNGVIVVRTRSGPEQG